MRGGTPNRARRLMMTSSGWHASGGGRAVPRLAARELARRGWDVTVFHAAVESTPSGSPYELREWVQDGVRLIGVHNRLDGPFDIGNPLGELDDPPITAAFAAALDRRRPDVVHFHDLRNLGAALIEEAVARAIPAHLTSHNYWLICPRANLLTGIGSICDGPGDGSGCSDCVGAHDPDGHRRRLGEIRARAERGLHSILAVSPSIRRTLLAAGYPAQLVDVVRQALPPRPFSGYVDELEAYYAGERPGRVASGLSASELTVRWEGDHGLGISLSNINDRITERLPGAVERVERDGSSLDAPLPHVADVVVRNHRWPPDLRPPSAGRLAVIQAWEFGAVPRDWLDAIEQHVDELWVPSEHVRRMYLHSGADPDRVVVIPNGVDLDVFTPAADRLRIWDGDAPPVRDGALRFLFVGGLIWRKGPDVLVDAWRRAFAGRDDVTLVLKDFGVGTLYPNEDRSGFRELAALGEAPRIELIEDDLEPAALAALYRSCDVLVHPYRGEGFAMTVLEAMACGLPVIVTGCPPTNEFCPPEAGWRIRAHMGFFPDDRVDTLVTAGRPWVAEPDPGHLVELLQAAAAAGPRELAARGRAGREAALQLSWDAVAARYRERLVTLAGRTPRLAAPPPDEPLSLAGEAGLRVLATPAWRGEDRLGELLCEWSHATGPQTSACLYLLADPHVDGDPAALESRILAAAASMDADLALSAEVKLLVEPFRAGLDRRLHAAVDVYVPLHAACVGHARIARDAGNRVAELGSGALATLL
jgi:glycosyltransferase involved in cell wall biosynthesis